MNELKVRVVRLEPMRVAFARAVSEAPEREAWEKLKRWASPRGLLETPGRHPVFGFNNPNPTPERKEYGYEFWIGVDPGTDGEGEIEVKDFAGGLYAVTTCRLQADPTGSVPEIWKRLWNWAHSDKSYRWRKTHELEQCRIPDATGNDIELDLYLPVEERVNNSRRVQPVGHPHPEAKKTP